MISKEVFSCNLLYAWEVVDLLIGLQSAKNVIGLAHVIPEQITVHIGFVWGHNSHAQGLTYIKDNLVLAWGKIGTNLSLWQNRRLFLLDFVSCSFFSSFSIEHFIIWSLNENLKIGLEFGKSGQFWKSKECCCNWLVCICN